MIEIGSEKILASREGAAEEVWGKFRRARAFRRSEAEAVSFVQNRFGFRQTNAPKLTLSELTAPRELFLASSCL
ncbi:MAG: hypothetical protein A3I88_02020 [Candidatus Portnoybacteria bacterium RIFCSPLOWO2_12_FULL_39_9]|uniref:Uncharacterized protein n=1 Tax=Candidatus Portnoybacteria bacterium RIFCSPHIGHO2_12_FULL_38_9 TaxID=1801997 RepID=A0A1G2FF61_9BACT|nr:MAG: hypothetical protein A3H00_00565 [Candidatus Portnoybacteria bacterium RBG_13_40_8]OGZ36181.1 MAG: hypothetical protein A3J64_00240 [Candidatus Portnoybacteria bacterium RIFCSPHIGHO2_12_FULL_38_9]OGZ37207.1 MAG: hypothetical protein A2646_03410 [Candidatus Portnoybacteria bacterium RIFCSPHIGHO2_02_FULL_39_12]OGZ38586.1 MAG: hypothetical protein A3F21_01160 [Candidatus Portnoybacteria bacterium RIFCSPLOWO2_01_FULL_38_39]OGZ41227.1 MAG: hypothetical protein A3I88_02020 [Candidatus Portnoy